ncbi:hypothetical protein C3747_10g241 [Trypanosoma cruzi]|uniref:Uncharacterized protein n=2 Tax=Trypanosoma cruzi TaxID=5693 RepID=Q4CYL0_TRYCC|nr:hypothetical protein, conserved [Trypanosoma cruzi]EAN85360.1 hypothetical protein, conserved [Trypanosoma cruzi]PWU91945.1 hypothetical protein C3747_329g20 [Trypanosoma cruzi]PWV19452.1 hypothetical protein C3747_10g241 [Trypanosoma cruzi]RNC44327.1 hypothetical protein TcCL_NonESM05918 [Trypanosoma cruzi]|eukprot:XP_807211.1 hypothetical protein [Trypanosoma cruzi strain CL Brener]
MESSTLANAIPFPGGKNILVALEESNLYIYCDLSQDLGRTSSGKNILIATTGGNKPLGATNAFLGLNVFCNITEGPKLTDETTSKLSEVEIMGYYCMWQVKGHTLCMMIDFENAWEKLATTGNSVVLASSGGNKAVGKTGILCGLNCHVPLGKKFLMEKLSTIVNNDFVSVGDTVELNEGFVVHVESETQVTLHCEYEYTMATRRLAMPPVVIEGETSLILTLRFVDKKLRSEEKVEQMKTEFAVLSPKWKNLLLRYGPNHNGNNSRGTVDFYLRFDPTQFIGRSFSGKSLTVSSSGGWCSIGNEIFIMFNAHKPAPHLSPAEIRSAVQNVLDSRRVEEITSLSLKKVEILVVTALNLKGSSLADVRGQVKEAVKAYMGSLKLSVPFKMAKKAVNKAFATRKREEFATLSLKTLLAEVSSELGAAHWEEETLKAHVKEAVMQCLWGDVRRIRGKGGGLRECGTRLSEGTTER